MYKPSQAASTAAFLNFIENRAEATHEWLQYIKNNKIKLDAVIAKAGVLGLDRVRFYSDRHFEFAGDGILAGIITALDHAGEIVDLIAWPADHRHLKFCSKFGHAALLGADQIDADLDLPLRVWRSPFTWLQHRARGVVIIDRARSVFWLGGTMRQLVAEDREHARELSKLLRRQVNAPAQTPTILQTEEAA